MNAIDQLPTPPCTDLLQGVSRLTHLGVIRISGDDAAKFIHGQLSQDFALLGNDGARLAAYCTAQGRMLASFIGLRHGSTDILLVCSADLLQACVQRLSMFVMRAKARISDASAEFTLAGLAGTAVTEPALPRWHVQRTAGHCCITLPTAAGAPRALWLAPAGSALPAGAELSPALWQWGEVHSGVATVSQAVAQAFVPQMLNYESVGGISFKKGCYPGQEVVARSQYRGTRKRRAYVVHSSAALHAGEEIFSSHELEQPAGMVVQAAPAPGGGYDAIASLQIGAASQGGLCTAAPLLQPIQQFELPYVLLDEV